MVRFIQSFSFSLPPLQAPIYLRPILVVCVCVCVSLSLFSFSPSSAPAVFEFQKPRPLFNCAALKALGVQSKGLPLSHSYVCMCVCTRVMAAPLWRSRLQRCVCARARVLPIAAAAAAPTTTLQGISARKAPLVSHVLRYGPHVSASASASSPPLPLSPRPPALVCARAREEERAFRLLLAHSSIRRSSLTTWFPVPSPPLFSSP